MTLKELQQLIKEEFEALTADGEISEADDLDVNVDADEVAAEKNPEDTLKRVFDMLKDYFEGEEEENVEDEVGEDMMDEVKDDETKNEEADLEERAAQGFGDPGPKNTHGKDAGYTPAKVTRGDGKLHEEDSKEEETKSALQERFQILANIIK